MQPTETIPPAIESTASQNASTSSLQNAPESIARKSKRPKTFNPVVDIDASTVTSKPNSGDRAELLDVDPNSGRRKRRKTAENKVGTEGSEGHTEAGRPVPKRQPRQKDLPGSVQNCPDLDSTANVQSVDVESEGDENHQNVFKQVGDAQGMHNAPKPERTRTPSSEDLIGPPPIGTGAKCIKSQLFRIEDLIGPPPITLGTNSSTTSTEIPNEVRPKKILRLNPMTGTIGSPPAKKPLRALEPEGKKAPASKQKVKTKVVIIRYSHGKGIGQKIDRILHRTKLIISLPSKVLPETQKPPVSAAKPPKTLHPLFLGKAAVKKGTTPPKPTLKGVIDLSCAQEPPRPRSRGKSSPTKPAPVTFSGFGAAKLMKYPGAIEPAWPWRDMVHIRGIDPNEVPPQLASTPLQTRSRKFKYQAIEVSPAESILGTLANELCIEKAMKEIREINPDEYPPVPACLRIPSKHYEPGLTIQRRVLKELHTRPVFPTLGDQSSTEDEIQTTKKARRPSCHAALLKVYASIPKSFSAFDFGQCENQAWIQKYAPKAAEEVLQAGSEARILKAWLQRLTVQSVEAGLGDQPESRAGRSKSSKSEKLGNRKRKSKKLDDFIVSTEDEDDDMDEVTESEDGASPNGKQDLLKKTVIRAGDAAALGSKEPGKLTNATLISGPHGCGKTAAVYAVAKELGFEVFEINSSSRRSGRDILERVGDMARNHQVQRSSDVPTTDPIDDDKQRIDDALANDLQSGRQGTMNSFFKPKQETKPDTKPKPKTKTETQRRAATQKTLFSRRPAKQQKQSLIFLEEVDILYKEDTQFWGQVVSLISMSKRPIIMTCNDESVLPITSLSLTFHAILRFAPPPIDLAIDHMLLVAACEGHVLRRESVKTLYEGRNSDLRASLTELQFWCQFAVGDVKRGLDWYYPRWSRREDIDEEGNTIRVVSEGTYETGMGWLSQDFLESDIHHLDVEEEMLHEVYDSWHADASNDAKYRTGMDRWAKKIQTLSSGRNDNKAALAMYADFAEAMSSADLCSGGIFAPDNRVRFFKPAILQLKTYSPSLRLHSTLAYLNYPRRRRTTTSSHTTSSKLRHLSRMIMSARTSTFGCNLELGTISRSTNTSSITLKFLPSLLVPARGL